LKDFGRIIAKYVGMKIKISKSQWEGIGKKAGWMGAEKEESQKWWGSLSINEMKELTRKYYSDPHITWSFINDSPSFIEDIYKKEHTNSVNAAKKGDLKKTAQNNIDIFQFMEDWSEEGYGIALVSPDNIIIDPYIDPSDYPDMILNKSGNGARVIGGKHKGCMMVFHSGQLEGNIGKDWTDIANPQVALKNAAKKGDLKKKAGGHGRFSEDLSDVIEGKVLSNKGKSSQEIFSIIKSDAGIVSMMREDQMSDQELMEVIDQSKSLYNI
jgi:hypothetical protein